MATFFRNTVASPGTFGCRGSFIDLLRLLIRQLTPTTACGSPSPPAFHDFVHQRGERASPSCTGRESRARSARSDRFYGGKARDFFLRVFFWPALPVPYLLNFFSKLSDSTAGLDCCLFFFCVSNRTQSLPLFLQYRSSQARISAALRPPMMGPRLQLCGPASNGRCPYQHLAEIARRLPGFMP